MVRCLHSCDLSIVGLNRHCIVDFVGFVVVAAVAGIEPREFWKNWV